MPVVINGTGAVTGVTSLPDGIVTVDDLSTSGTASASTFLSGTGAWAAAGGGKVVQRVSTQTGALVTGTTAGPYLDDTISQLGEGDQVLSLSLSPTSASNKLQIFVNIVCGLSAGSLMGGLFQDSTANALASTMHYLGTANTVLNLTLCHTMTAGTTSSTTFKVRVGSQVGHTISLNGVSGGRLHGGTLISSMIIEEYE